MIFFICFMTISPIVTDKADCNHATTVRHLFSSLACYPIGASYTQFRKKIYITENFHFQRKISVWHIYYVFLQELRGDFVNSFMCGGSQHCALFQSLFLTVCEAGHSSGYVDVSRTFILYTYFCLFHATFAFTGRITAMLF